MSIRNMNCLGGAVGIALFLFLIGNAVGDNIDLDIGSVGGTAMNSRDRDVYAGTIRVYVIEVESRWIDYDGAPYHDAFLSFALEEDFNLDETDSLTWYVEWNGNDYGYGDVEKNSIKVVAAVFDSVSYTGSSDPPDGQLFNVHEVDAVAGAKCGKTGYNLVPAGFTHTILVEDGSATG